MGPRVILVTLVALMVPAAATSAATTRRVEATVSLANRTAAPLSAWTLKLTLGRGTRLTSPTAHVKRSGATVTLRGPAIAAGSTRTVHLIVRGAKAPAHFAFASRACTTKPAHRRGSTARLTVRCATQTTPASTPAPTPAPVAPTAPGTPAAAAAGNWFRFSPFADMALASPPDLAGARSSGGVKDVTLGFVTARGNTDCVPTWGGYPTYAATGASPYQRSLVDASRAAGGDVAISFGGAAGSELATRCTSVAALQSAYQSVVDAYSATHIDFDVEGAAIADTAANTRRAQAIAGMQKAATAAGKPLAVALTLPVLPSGLDANGVALVKDAVANGVQISLVNIMAMDYGDGTHPDMGDRAIQAATSTAAQLRPIFPTMSAADVLAHLGVTPMAGVNDQPDEVFTLSDAHDLQAWASQNHIGALSMWSLARDRACPGKETGAQDDCSTIDQSPYDFAKALGAFTG